MTANRRLTFPPSAERAHSRKGTHRAVSAIPRTVFLCTEPASNESLSTPGTLKRYAWGTDEVVREGLERFAAPAAFANQAAIRPSWHGKEKRVAPPEIVIGCAVTWAAQRREVRQIVSFNVRGEKTERDDVIDCKLLDRTARKAFMPVAMQCQEPLRFPIGAAISPVTTAPCGILFASKQTLRNAHV